MFWDEINKREMSIGQLLRMALKIFRENKKAIMLVTFIIFIPINIAVALIPLEQAIDNLMRVVPPMAQAVDYNYILNNLQNILSAMLEYYKWQGSIYIIQTFFGCIALMGVAYITYQFIEGNKLDYKFTIEEAFSKWIMAIVTILARWVIILVICVITSIIAMISPVFIVLLLMPILFIMVYTNFMLYAVVVRGQRGFKAIKYSYDLIKGRFLRTVGKLLVIGAIQMAWAYVISSAFLTVQSNEVIIFIRGCFDVVISACFWVVQTIMFLNYEATCDQSEKK